MDYWNNVITKTPWWFAAGSLVVAFHSVGAIHLRILNPGCAAINEQWMRNVPIPQSGMNPIASLDNAEVVWEISNQMNIVKKTKGTYYLWMGETRRVSRQPAKEIQEFIDAQKLTMVDWRTGEPAPVSNTIQSSDC